MPTGWHCAHATFRYFSLAIAAFAGAALCASPAVAGTVIGTVRAPGAVWISDGSKPAPVAASMHNSAKAFVPEVLIVPAGSTVTFPNDDPFLHSIYSAGGANAFDLGFYGTGPGKQEVLPNAGVLDVACHIHPLMHAIIIVVDGPSATTDDTSFVLANVASGRHVLHAWSGAYGERTTVVTVPAGRGSITLDKPL